MWLCLFVIVDLGFGFIVYISSAVDFGFADWGFGGYCVYYNSVVYIFLFGCCLIVIDLFVLLLGFGVYVCFTVLCCFLGVLTLCWLIVCVLIWILFVVLIDVCCMVEICVVWFKFVLLNAGWTLLVMLWLLVWWLWG